MKIITKPDAVQPEQLKADLAEHFKGHKIIPRSKTVFFIGKSGTIGAGIIVKKDKILVNGNFPTMGGQMAFTMGMVLLGILIPLIIYFAAFHSKLQAYAKEVGTFIQDKYGVK